MGQGARLLTVYQHDDGDTYDEFHEAVLELERKLGWRRISVSAWVPVGSGDAVVCVYASQAARDADTMGYGPKIWLRKGCER
jgi:hypothetical protein